MEYNKIKLLFIVLTYKLVAAQNLNNLSYGELGLEEYFMLVGRHEVNDTLHGAKPYLVLERMNHFLTVKITSRCGHVNCEVLCLLSCYV